ncbi:MAG: substrate-binding domain-containing protein [Desulfovibrionaceae bacterium]
MAVSVVLPDREEVLVLHAGSLSAPFSEIARHFEAAEPGLVVRLFSGGSTELARRVLCGEVQAHILASADYKVIDELLFPDHAAANILFASNELVLCYTEQSRHAGEIGPENWPDVLARPGVRWGHSDPERDPCGYRSLMVLCLAERHYAKPGLMDELLSRRRPEWVPPKAADLVGLLRNGQLDYAWEYLSVAKQHGLSFVRLDSRLSLGDLQHEKLYAAARVQVGGRTLQGGAVLYGVCLLQGAPERGAAAKFLGFLLDPAQGLRILAEAGQPVLTPVCVRTSGEHAALPESLRAAVKVLEECPG